jgi:hypothetical protein
MTPRVNALDSLAEAFTNAAVLALRAGTSRKGHEKPRVGANSLARPDAAQQAEQEREDGGPPGQFVSNEHEADCSRFLEEVRELARRRSEAGLSRGIGPR